MLTIMAVLPPMKYPIGIYSLEKIINRNLLYVDKTQHVYNMTHSFEYVFLSRPRRFGKSLLVDTLQCYFEARKELFNGLAIESLETEWVKYPVLRFDMSSLKNKDIAELKQTLNNLLYRYESVYGASPVETSFGGRLENLIHNAYAQTGQKVVLLIDEYDSPMLEVSHDKEKLTEVRDILRNFYGPIKICDAQLRFGFITGITKFSQMGIFSGINNLMDVSMLDDYSDICGISKEELHSGTPTFLLEQLKHFKTKLADLDGQRVMESSFSVSPEYADSALPVLYQAGYLTIKGYDPEFRKYTLGFPNDEVRYGFLNTR